jgi:hypothetical protein
MSIRDKLIRLDQTKHNQSGALFRPASSDWTTYPDLLRERLQYIGDGSYFQSSKTVEFDPSGMTVTPDFPYDGLLEVILKGDPNFKPENIINGVSIFGVSGCAKPVILTEYPSYLPIAEEEFDNMMLDYDPQAPIDDKFVLVDNNGNIIVGYMYGTNTSTEFHVTSYRPETTEFTACGWVCLTYYIDGEKSGNIILSDYRDDASTGGNYLIGMRSCSRSELYYAGLEIWPNCNYGDQAYLFDEGNSELYIFKDDGSLSYSFDWSTLHADIREGGVE